MAAYPVEKLILDPPPLEELVFCIENGLKSNFRDVSVSVTSCPDLTIAPFSLAASGLCGNECVADIGGPANLSPLPKKDKKYSLLDMTRLMEMERGSGFILGAGAGPFHVIGVNSELMPNLAYEADNISNLTYYARIRDDGGTFCTQSPSTDFALMANLFGCNGQPGHVLKIMANTRTGDLNFTAAIQNALTVEFGRRTVSLGGVFIIKKGKANLHVMPDFSEEPLVTREATEKWLRYFDMSAPLVCLSVFHSHDPGLGLRMEHTHCFSEHGEGGHYHDDVTPEEVEYEAYFNVAKVLYRIDRP